MLTELSWVSWKHDFSFDESILILNFLVQGKFSFVIDQRPFNLPMLEEVIQ